MNEAQNRRRWFARHCRREVSIENHGEEDRNALDFARDPGRSPYDQVLDGENRALVERALTRINPIFQSAVVLRDIQNLSYEEIADDFAGFARHCEIEDSTRP